MEGQVPSWPISEPHTPLVEMELDAPGKPYATDVSSHSTLYKSTRYGGPGFILADLRAADTYGRDGTRPSIGLGLVCGSVHVSD